MKYSRILIFIIPFIPLVWFNSLIFPFVTSKALAFFFIVELIGVCLVLSLPKKITLQIGVAEGIMSLLVVWLCITAALSENSLINFWGTVERMTGVILWVHLFLFLVVIRMVCTEKDYHHFFALSFVASSIVSLFGLLQHSNAVSLTDSEGRTDVLFGNPVFLSAYILLNIGIGLFLFIKTKRGHLRWLFIFFLFIHLIVLFYAGTRGSILGLLSGIFVGCLAYAFSRSVSSRLRYYALGGGILTLCIVGSLFTLNQHAFFPSNPILERFSTISLTTITQQARYYLWEAALDGIGKNPLFGVGLESFGDVFDIYREPVYFGEYTMTSLPEPWSDRAHNAFLDMGSGAGIPGMILFLGMFGYALFVFYTNTRLSTTERSVLIGTVVAYGVHSLFTFSMFVDLMLFTVFIAYAGQLDTRRYVYELKPQYVSVTKVVVVLLLIFLFVSSLNRMLFSYQTRSMLSKSETGSEKEFYGYAELSQRKFIDRSYALKELPFSGLLVLASHTMNTRDLEKMVTEVKKAEEDLRRHGQLEIRDRYYFGAFYRNVGKHGEAIRIFREAVDLASSNQILLIEYGKTLAASKDIKGALDVLEKAYLLEPTYKEAVLIYARTLIQAGQGNKADDIVQGFFGKNVTALEVLSKVD